MQIHETLTRGRCLTGVPGSSKKRVLEVCSKELADEIQPPLEPEALFAALFNRERLGSTAIGEGVAIPHCRLEGCTQAVGALVRLEEPVDFDAPDRESVDLLFILLVPTEATEAHLQLLASLAEMFSRPEVRARLREAKDADDLYRIAVDYDQDGS